MKKPPLKILLVLAVFMPCVLLLFIPWTDTYYPRSLKTLWNLGHFLLFACGTFIGLHYLYLIPWLRSRAYEIQLVVVLIIACGSGLAIEYIQIRLGRSFSLDDVRLDLAGAFCAFIWFSRAESLLSNIVPRISKGVAVLLIVIGLMPLSLHLFDEVKAYNRFPELAGFQSDLELSRFSSTATLTREDSALQILFGTEQYSVFGLNYFPRDWRGYKTLQLHFNNPNQRLVKLVCRIHDIRHNHLFNDRYNQEFLIQSGEQTLNIQLKTVRSQLKYRKMDLSQVGQLACFTMSLSTPTKLILRRINLSY